jgi:hypothetical protein
MNENLLRATQREESLGERDGGVAIKTVGWKREQEIHSLLNHSFSIFAGNTEVVGYGPCSAAKLIDPYWGIKSAMA